MAAELQVWLNDVLRKHVHYRDNKVCVVTVIGKSPFSGHWNKISPINDVLGRKAFENLACASRRRLDCGSEIEAFFDATLQTVFLHFISPYDTSLQSQTYPAESEDFFSWWTKRDEMYAAHLLTLFLSSHVILLMHPTCRLDTSYFRLFRVLEEMREKSLNAVCDILAETNGVSKGWSSNGRLCSPRLLFGFHRPPSFMKADGTVETKQVSYRKVERSLEDQIYGLFRKSRVITNNAANALMALPANQSFVYVFPPAEEPRDLIQDLLNNLRTATGAAKEKADSSDKNADDESASGGGFKEFLLEHIDLAHSEGFNDNLGKVGPAFFELPKLKAFVRGMAALHDYFVVRYNENLELEELPDLLDVTVRFSEGRCKKVLPMAISAYMDGLPQYYASVYHETKLAQALQILQHQARGPALERTQVQLIGECEGHWRNGRQACETLSLTGNPCVSRIHRTKESGEELDNEFSPLPVLRHTSKIKFLSTCNCGRRQAWRDDPFTLREANYEFYEWRDEFECCRRRAADRIDYPTYTGPQGRRTVSLEGEDEELASRGERDRGALEEFEGGAESGDKDQSSQQREEMKTAEKMFDRLKIATQSQEERNDSRGPSAGEDLLPDRDNKPATSGRLDGRESLADIEGFGSANADTFGEREMHEPATVITQEDGQMDGQYGSRAASTGGGGEDGGDQEQYHIRRPSSGGGRTRKRSIFADVLNADDVYVDSAAEPESGGSREEEHAETCILPDATSENEGPADDMEEIEKELEEMEKEEGYNSERPKSRSTEPEATEGEKRDWATEEAELAPSEHGRDQARRLVEEDARDGVDYLSGMIHSLCPPGLLPLFSSWSLVCIGSSSVYSHSHGLRDQPNFSHGSNFLLPWDVQLRVDVERWQEQMESMAAASLKRAGPYKKPRQPKKGSNGAVSVKIFVGFEYECPRGHRFMLQSPDRILKHSASGSGGPKENGGQLIKNDAPLWFPCSCRQAKSGFPGQLMRVHVVTPKAPVIVTLNPRVQPRASAPGKPPLVFHPGAPGPAKLDPAQYWVLRLPFVYVGPEGPCYPPRDSAYSSGRMLRGMINVFPDLEH